MTISIAKKSILIIIIILLIDQISKIIIKTNMYLGQNIKVFGDWFIIHFTENNGMAFGFEFGGDIGKLCLGVFRIVAISSIIYYLYLNIKEKKHTGFIISLSLILAGAIGNILDSMFYGLLFTDSGYWEREIAEVFPPDGGYAPFLFGKVVDMLYFPIIETTIPSWFPFWANEYFIFFRPVFNIADSAITIGILIIFIFQKRFFKDKTSIKTTHNAA